MNKTKSKVAFLSIATFVLLLQQTTVAVADRGLAFTTEASFVATQHPDLGSPFGGMGFDPAVEKVEILARYIPNNTRPLTIFEFEGTQASFGTFVRDFHNSFFFGPESAFPAITYDSVHGVAYLLEDQGTRIVINPRHVNPRNAPSNNFIDFIVSETGPAGITYDERDDTLVILLRSDGTNSGQQLIRIPYNSGTIIERTPVDATLAIDRNSEIALDPATGNYFISVGAQIFEITPDGLTTGRFFSPPNKLTVMGMEFGTGNKFFILEVDGTVSRGALTPTITTTATITGTLIITGTPTPTITGTPTRTLTEDSDGDGIVDNDDACPNSDLSATVVIDGCNSGVPNSVFPSGCTISDLIAACAENPSNHGQFVSCVSHLTNDLKKGGTITGQQKGAIQSCAGKAHISSTPAATATPTPTNTPNPCAGKPDGTTCDAGTDSTHTSICVSAVCGQCTANLSASPRFVDNGDGTITDRSTCLVWEKKDAAGGLHDKDNTYTWCRADINFLFCDNAGGPPDGSAFTVFIAGLNSAGFAAHHDWRLPAEDGQNPPFIGPKELESIVDTGAAGCGTSDNLPRPLPCVDPAFNTGCTAGCSATGATPCSCTVATAYWSGTTLAGNPEGVWIVLFQIAIPDPTFGFASSNSKALVPRSVRAVRGGL